jgi:hypothetical protein
VAVVGEGVRAEELLGDQRDVDGEAGAGPEAGDGGEEGGGQAGGALLGGGVEGLGEGDAGVAVARGDGGLAAPSASGCGRSSTPKVEIRKATELVQLARSGIEHREEHRGRRLGGDELERTLVVVARARAAGQARRGVLSSCSGTPEGPPPRQTAGDGGPKGWFTDRSMRALRGVMGRIGWETFARARAKLDAGLDREAVLAEAGVDPETWSREQEALLAELADEVERADFARLEAYRAAYQATWTQVTDLAITEPRQGGESAGEPTKLPAFHDPMPPVEVQQASFQRAAPVAQWLPAVSPMQPEPSQITSVPDEHPVDATLPPSGLVPRDPLPFQHAASPQAAPWQEGDSSHRLPPPPTQEPPPPPPLLPGATIAPPRSPVHLPSSRSSRLPRRPA